MNKKNKITQSLATSLLVTSVMFVAYTPQAEAAVVVQMPNCSYNNDNSTVTALVVCNRLLDINGSSTTTFEENVVVNNAEDTLLNIYDTATPTFLGTVQVVDNSLEGQVNIYGQSAPIFKNKLTTDNLTVYNDAKPEFYLDVKVNKTVNIEGNAIPVFHGKLDISRGLNINHVKSIMFKGPVTADKTFIGSTDVTFESTFNSRLINISNASKVLFLSDVQVDENIVLNVDASPTFSGTVTATTMTFEDVNNPAQATFTDGSVLDAAVTTDSANTGNLIFKPGATANKPIGEANLPLNTVTFEGGDATKTSILRANIYSGEIRFGSVKADIQNNITLVSVNNATEHLNNTILNLNGNTVTQVGSVVNDAGNITFNTLFVSQAQGIGHIEQQSGNFNMVNNTNGVIINLTENAGITLPIINVPENYDLFVEVDETGSFTLADNGNVTLNSPVNPFVIWSHADGILTRTLVDNPEEVLAEIVDNNPNLPLVSPALVTELTNIAASEGGSAAIETLDRLANTDALALATTPVGRIYENATQSISDRANSFSASPLQLVQSDASGLSAGEAELAHGVWVSPFYGEVTQKVRRLTPGYKAQYYGGVIGADTLLNDDTTIGVAFSAIRMDVKHKDLNIGDRSKADTYVGSLYGTYQLSDKWFVQGVAAFARSKIKNSELGRQFGGMATARANYTSDGWGSELLLGYNYKIGSNMLFTPTAGFEYNRMNQIKYQETGTVNQNLLVTRKAVNRVEAIIGARLSTSYEYKDWLIIPEMQGNIRHDLNGKKLNVDIRQVGVDGPTLIPRTSRVSRTIGNLGVAISARNNDRMEYGIEYDARLAEKYIGHQGTLKVRMNF